MSSDKKTPTPLLSVAGNVSTNQRAPLPEIDPVSKKKTKKKQKKT